MEDININSLSEYLSKIQETVFMLNGFKQDSVFFRGHANKSWELKPSVFRDDYLKHESEMMQRAYNQYPYIFINCENDALGKLVIMQHYRLRTRLLDITENPLVALYFACQEAKENEKKDGCVYYTNHKVELNHRNAKILVCLAEKTNDSDFASLRKTAEEANLLKTSFPDDNFWEIISNDQIFFPVYNTPRIAAQSGAFIISKISKLINKPKDKDGIIKKATSTIDKIFENKRFIIDKDKKEDILKELDLAGIN